MDEPFRIPPDEAGMRRADRHITRASLITLVLAAIAGLAAWLLLPEIFAFPVQTADRLAFALVATLPAFLSLAVATMMVSTARRYSARDIGGSAAGPPSTKLAIKVAFLQNTLEQTVLAAGFFMIYAAILDGSWLSLLPVAAGFFVIGRALFYRGYRQGVEGRALGMTLTMVPTILLALIACGAWLASLVSPAG